MPSGSWARVTARSDGRTADVIEHGPRAPWTGHLELVDRWNRHGRPEITRLGLTVTPAAHCCGSTIPPGRGFVWPTDQG
ncbi:hypothetical protein FHR81_001329 [Actinoalloteichus hoggarensis]|uniref:hypothetical protein n=1 Tax=Actinoalloteichus hoggarensis TaxID=1470176 RepID=UPI000B8B5F8B|nr:hypothetical protein [Actinoalloteichus hoggarensis]MBB5920299.1 hypothetical protein [Actinoalloteichus hoggarensis]